MDAYTAFLKGLKPSYLSAHVFRDKHENLLKSDHPSLQLFSDLTFFFATDKLKTKFIKSSSGLDFDSPEYKYQLGNALGFPPIASQFFADTFHDSQLTTKAAGYYYYGRHFGGHINDAEDIAKWLWGQVPCDPGIIDMIYENQDYQIKFENGKSVIMTSGSNFVVRPW